MSPDDYYLSVTAGPTYEKQDPVPVNSPKAVHISTPHLDAQLQVRIKDFRGQPPCEASSPYFSYPSHTTHTYSIAFSFVPKKDIPATDLVFGNDFDQPIRDRLPPLFGKAMKFVTSWVDPGIEGDPYADQPYLYGPLVSSVNVLRIGEKGQKIGERDGEKVIEEGADGEEAEKVREELGIPGDGPARMKFFLDKGHKEKFVFEKGRRYECDFFNGYLDFNQFALKLPYGLSFSALYMWDGQALRYVLRNRATGDLIFSISFALVPKKDVEGQNEPGKEAEPSKGEKPGEEDDMGVD
ncbi:DUF1769-domain-containing protein [Trichodelitschia bisporula]|uniref:DUF1769-domain-containing protein n=1 Tax=Trichodelitschia bisporula TaxID=703511 RepID=A0A6G1I3S1_9PEZI|nr:DUF1769-domain-containing protein [Trichodelitschia bisporula]